jgi:S-formylglutathione hydrolase FrmB
MTSGALRAPVRTRVLLPGGYVASPQRRFPVLYLMHGGFGRACDWTDRGGAEQITAGAPLIVVMPGGGNGGWCTDWHNGGRGGPPMWETFHIRQLIPWVDARYRSLAGRHGRAIAGTSTGGFCAMSYAARHPDLFAWAGSFSGAVDIVHNGPVVAVIGAEAIADGGGRHDVFGSRRANLIGWRAANPCDLAANLRGLILYLATRDGRSGGGRPADFVEQQVHEMNLAFHQRLLELGIDHVWRDRGAGAHSWRHWQADLREALPLMLTTFANPPETPSAFSYTTATGRYDVYGWQVALRPPVTGFSTLDVTGPAGFAVTGIGAADVLTPAAYRPGSRHRVRIRVGELTRDGEAAADAQGRLHLAVPLGHGGPGRAAVTVGDAATAGAAPGAAG